MDKKVEDGEAFLKNEVNREQFHLILFQHPNIQALSEKFTRIFQAADAALAPGGRIYSTFYYQPEVEFFRDSIRPDMQTRKGTFRYQNDCFFKAKFVNRRTKEVYSPESHSFMSAAKIRGPKENGI